MYEKIVRGNDIEIRENFNSPTIYLDHWTLREISSNIELRNKFVDLMNSKGGTLRISIYNMVELTRQADITQVSSIISLINDILDCGLINVDPRDVVNKENMLISSPSLMFNPSAETDIVANYLMSKNYPDSWHVSEIIKGIIDELPSEKLAANSVNFVEDMQKLLSNRRGNRNDLHESRKRFNKQKVDQPKYQAATRELFQLAIDFVVINSNMKMTKYSEWIDMFHVIVPFAYCDMVLTDKRWKTFISQTGMFHPAIAKVFDKRTLDDFFKEIESWGGGG